MRVVLAVGVAFLLAACGETWTVTYDGNARGDDEMAAVVLTPDGDDSYVIDSTGVKLRTEALPSNVGGNLRTIFWPAEGPAVQDGQSCATWTAQSSDGYVQQGAALRVTTDSTGVSRAITVTKNIYGGFTTIFNIHAWDTSKAVPNVQIGQVDMVQSLHRFPYPWHVCARAVGTSVSLKTWSGTQPEPEWDDALHVRSATIDEQYVYPGKAGWYIGHLPAGSSADFTNLKTWKYAADDSDAPDPDGGKASLGSGDGTPDRVKVSAEP
jgi:hypothetical protein